MQESKEERKRVILRKKGLIERKKSTSMKEKRIEEKKKELVVGIKGLRCVLKSII